MAQRGWQAAAPIRISMTKALRLQIANYGTTLIVTVSGPHTKADG